MYQSLINQLKTSDDVLAYNITIQNEPILIIFNKDLADIDEFNKFYYDKLCLNIKNNLLNVFPYLINVGISVLFYYFIIAVRKSALHFV